MASEAVKASELPLISTSPPDIDSMSDDAIVSIDRHNETLDLLTGKRLRRPYFLVIRLGILFSFIFQRSPCPCYIESG